MSINPSDLDDAQLKRELAEQVGDLTAQELEQRLGAVATPGPAYPDLHLREAYVPFSLRREGETYVLDVPPRGQKKKILLGGLLENRPDGFFAVLEVGPKGDLMDFLRRVGEGRTMESCRVRVLMVE